MECVSLLRATPAFEWSFSDPVGGGVAVANGVYGDNDPRRENLLSTAHSGGHCIPYHCQTAPPHGQHVLWNPPGSSGIDNSRLYGTQVNKTVETAVISLLLGELS